MAKGVRQLWQCKTCEELHKTEAEAVKCFKSTEAAVFAVGDIVVTQRCPMVAPRMRLARAAGIK